MREVLAQEVLLSRMVDTAPVVLWRFVVGCVSAGCSGDYCGVRGPWRPVIFTINVVALFPLEVNPLWWYALGCDVGFKPSGF